MSKEKKNLILVKRMRHPGDRLGYDYWIKPSIVSAIRPYGGYCEVATARETFFVLEPAEQLADRINNRAGV